MTPARTHSSAVSLFRRRSSCAHCSHVLSSRGLSFADAEKSPDALWTSPLFFSNDAHARRNRLLTAPLYRADTRSNSARASSSFPWKAYTLARLSAHNMTPLGSSESTPILK